MPLGIVSDDEFLKEVENSSIKKEGTIPQPKAATAKIHSPTMEEKVNEAITGIVEDMPSRGRQKGSVEVPDSLRKIIGETNEIEGRKQAIALAKSFGISSSSVSAYANGATSTATYDNSRESIVTHIQGRKDKVAGSALSILRQSFSLMRANEDHKLKACSAPELAGIARSMASVVKMMEPEPEKTNEVIKPQFVVFAPVMKDESHFEVIQLKE